jgi:hypothetical protein
LVAAALMTPAGKPRSRIPLTSVAAPRESGASRRAISSFQARIAGAISNSGRPRSAIIAAIGSLNRAA